MSGDSTDFPQGFSPITAALTDVEVMMTLETTCRRELSEAKFLGRIYDFQIASEWKESLLDLKNVVINFWQTAFAKCQRDGGMGKTHQ